MEPLTSISYFHAYDVTTHHSWYSTRLEGAQCLDHLEHVHYSLCLTAINHSGHGTEHATTSHCVTIGENTQCDMFVLDS